jgi:short-subunit dehydrogenase
MTDKTTSPKNILITGASNGVGRALAEHYAAQGHHLLLTGRNEDRLAATAMICRLKGAYDADTAVCDVRDRDALGQIIRNWDNITPVDIVIANAGISGGTGGLGGGEAVEQARLIFDVNVMGVFNTIEPLLSRMLARQAGQVVMIASLAGFAPFAGAPAYAASKAAVRVYGESLRAGLADTGVSVSVVCPGFIESGITDANNFPMPFFMKADKAAAKIARGIARKQTRIAFPWPMYLAAGTLGIMPPVITSMVTRLLPKKTRLQNES